MSGAPIVVVGSGASAVHYAATALDAGREVAMLDVGRPRPAATLPEATFRGLKRELADPVRWFLGERWQSLVLPDDDAEYYGFPPSKEYVFEGHPSHRVRSSGFAPLSSFARGGLAEAWTAGAYPFNDDELAAFPFGYAELAPAYARVARRIGVAGEEDDLAPFLPLHEGLSEPVELDEHARHLVRRYERVRASLHREHGAHLGRSRLAVLARDALGRGGCTELGRCLWGCPRDALWTPGVMLRELERRPGFTYLPDRFVTRFLATDGGRVTEVRARRADGGEERHPVERLVLAAGTLSTAAIYLASLARLGGERPALEGLMDNRQVLLPFVSLGRLGRRWEPERYQYHQLNLSLAATPAREYVHGQVTTLKTALVHPIVQGLPCDLRTALRLFRRLHGALGLVNVNLHDERRPENRVELDGEVLCVRYEAHDEERVGRVLATYRRVLRRLGALVPPGMAHVRPMGASVHYAGTLPMGATGGPHTTDADGRSRVFPNLYVVDGSVLPFLPAKNPTFTLMANATRVAERTL